MALLVADTSGLLAAFDRNEPLHEQILSTLDEEDDALVIPELVLAEMDYMLLRHYGREAEERFLEDVLSGAFRREPLLEVDLERATALIRKYRNLDIGLVDASIMACAERLGTNRVLTLDLRHFRTARWRDRRPFQLIPHDGGAAGRKR